MRTLNRIAMLALTACFILNVLLSTAHAQGTAFTYQGRLNDGGSLAHGTYDFRFKLFEDSLGNTQAGTTQLDGGVTVTNGLFLVTIDFGPGLFTGSNYWLEVDVRTNGAGAYTGLTPLQAVTPTPYAIFANTASNLSGTLPAGQLSGMVPSANLSGTYGNAMTFNNAGNSFSGNGTGLTGVNAATLNGLGAGNFWQIGGNAGTTAGANFVGTTDNQPLEFHINSQRALRLEPGGPSATLGNGIPTGAPNVMGGALVNCVSDGVIGAVIAGGGATNYQGSVYSNSVTADFGTIGGGNRNVAGGVGAWVGGGAKNTAGGPDAVVCGGFNNDATTNFSTIGGGYNNVASSSYAAVCAGYDNVATGFGSFIGGGGYDGVNFLGNTASGVAAVVTGGVGNSGGIYGFVGGGYQNTAGSYASVVSGEYNLASNFGAAVGGGQGNTAGGDYAAVAGGLNNNASGYCAFVAGNNNSAAGGSCALGTSAQAQDLNAFVWGDGSVTATDNGANTFNVLASHGMVLTVSGSAGLNPAALRVNSTSATGVGIFVAQNSSDATAVFTAAGTGDIIKGFSGSGGGNLAFEVLNDGTVKSKGMVLTSDRNAKANFTSLDAQAILAKVAQLPVTEWNYKDDGTGLKHIGPMAQDFHAAFGLNGSDDKHISVVDEGGVALAAIQGLNQKLQEDLDRQDAENAELKRQNNLLMQRLNELEATVKSLAANQ